MSDEQHATVDENGLLSLESELGQLRSATSDLQEQLAAATGDRKTELLQSIESTTAALAAKEAQLEKMRGILEKRRAQDAEKHKQSDALEKKLADRKAKRGDADH